MNMYVGPVFVMPETDDQGSEFTYVDLAARFFEQNGKIMDDLPPIPPRERDTVHEIKADPQVMQSVIDGLKKAEVRQDDRGYKCGDILRMRETTYSARDMRVYGQPLGYTGREAHVRVTHITRGYGLPADMVVMSFKHMFNIYRPENKS